jgi:hypothetical protein
MAAGPLPHQQPHSSHEQGSSDADSDSETEDVNGATTLLQGLQVTSAQPDQQLQ